MKLLVISHTPHYRTLNGFVGWGPTVIELGYLARLFDEVVHIAPLLDEPAPASALPYPVESVRYRPVQAAGGDTFISKVGLLLRAPAYTRAILSELRTADAVHVRCPAGISLVALAIFAILRKPIPRWYKYAGNWQPEGGEPLGYRIQRWWLRQNLSRGIATVNGAWPAQPPHVIPFENPCITEAERLRAGEFARLKQSSTPLRLLFVGRLDSGKGADKVVRICEKLKQQQLNFHCDLIGDGHLRSKIEKHIAVAGLQAQVRIHGWLPKTALGQFYSAAHFILLPTSSSEGWPKVLSEAMAYGVVPLTSAISSIPQVLGQNGAGLVFDNDNIDGFCNAILNDLHSPSEWKQASQAGVALSQRYTYETYLSHVASVFESCWGVMLITQAHGSAHE